MIINFRAHGIRRGARKLARTPILIKTIYTIITYENIHRFPYHSIIFFTPIIYNNIIIPLVTHKPGQIINVDIDIRLISLTITSSMVNRGYVDTNSLGIISLHFIG
jgi:hypothetical protein